MNDESGSALKIIAAIIGSILILIALLVLKTDPIREEGSQRAQAIQQVKSFASFIETRPEIAKTEPRSVIAMAQSRLAEAELKRAQNNRPTNLDFEKELKSALLTQAHDPSQVLALLKNNPQETYAYLEREAHVENLKRDNEWDQNIQLMLMVTGEKNFEPSVREKVLDLLGEQLLASRVDQSDVVRYHTDQWFEKYLQNENRPAKKYQMIEVFNERLLQANHLIVPATQEPPSETPEGSGESGAE